MKRSKRIGGLSNLAEAIVKYKEKNTSTKKTRSRGLYYFKAPQMVLEKCKVVYLVIYHQSTTNGKEKRFPKEQFVEFVDSNPLVARRNAFEYAKSTETFPDGEPIEYLEAVSKEPSSPLFLLGQPDIMRWCIIQCIEYATLNTMIVYTERNINPTSEFLDELSAELELYKRLGIANKIPTTTIVDEIGISHKVIAEGNDFVERKLAS